MLKNEKMNFIVISIKTGQNAGIKVFDPDQIPLPPPE